MPDPSRHAMTDVYESVKMMLEDPENKETYAVRGVSPTEVYGLLLQDKYSRSYVSTCMNALTKEGYLKEIPHAKKFKKKFFVLENKPYLYKPVLIKPTNSVIPTLVPEPKYPDIFYSEKELEEDINVLIDNLENVKALVPKVLAGLLDVTKAMGKFKKLKEILGDVTDLASKNL